MLVLQMKVDESVILSWGDTLVRVVVVRLRGDKVRLGFEAVDNIEIHREEVWDAIQQERSSGAK